MKYIVYSLHSNNSEKDKRDTTVSTFVLLVVGLTPEDGPRKGWKHVALPPTANKTDVDTVMSILSCSDLLMCRVSYYIIYLLLRKKFPVARRENSCTLILICILR
jgi:hypothetical protein